MTNEKEELPKKLTEWLKTQGYPLEMIVALAFQKANFRVSLSDFYKDFDTGESREIDVTVIRWSDLDEGVALQVCCRIECKSARDKPWIVFVSQAQPEFWFPPFQTLCSEAYRAFFFEVLKQGDFLRDLKNLSLFSPSHVGYGVTQAFTTGQDVPYRSVLGSVKASIDRVLQIDQLLTLPLLNKKPYYPYCVVFPAIVIDGKLFECFIKEDGDIILNEVQSSVLQWKGDTDPSHSSPFIHIVTKPALNQFVKDIDEAANKLIDSALAHKQELAKIAANIKLSKSQKQSSWPIG